MSVVMLALVAAALSALSAAGEQRAAACVRRRRTTSATSPGPTMRAPHAPRPRRMTLARSIAAIGFAGSLLSSPMWLGSWAVDAASFFVEAAALHLGSLSVVEPLMVTTLLFALPLAARGTQRLRGRDWAGAAMISLGLALILVTRSSPAGGPPSRAALFPALGAVVTAVTLLLVVGRGRPPVIRARFLSVAAGALFAVGAAMTKLTADTASTAGFVGLLTSWPGYALAVVSVTSFALQQAAYADGTLATAITAVVITDPLVSYVLGVVGFGEPSPRLAGPLLLAVLGGVLLVVGVYGLAHSPLLHAPAYPSSERAAPDTPKDRNGGVDASRPRPRCCRCSRPRWTSELGIAYDPAREEGS